MLVLKSVCHDFLICALSRPNKKMRVLNLRLLVRAFLILMLVFLCYLPALNAFAASVTLAWDANSEPDLAGYKIHYGTVSQNYQYSVDLGNFTSCTISSLREGNTYFFAASAYDTSYNESGYSEEVSYTVPIESGDVINDSNSGRSSGGGSCFISTVAGRKGQSAQPSDQSKVELIIAFMLLSALTLCLPVFRKSRP